MLSPKWVVSNLSKKTNNPNHLPQGRTGSDYIALVTAATVDSDPFDKIVAEIMRGSIELLGGGIPLPEMHFEDVCGPGYAIPSAEGVEAIELMAKNEGIILDTCYTGKAFAALVRMARGGRFKPQDNVLFLHTGGAGGLFAPDWEHMD